MAAGGAYSQDTTVPPSNVFLEGEELTYNVRYGFVDLGQVRISVTGVERSESDTSIRSKAFIDSYKGVPFVDLHATFESTMEGGTVYSKSFVGRTKEDNGWNLARYTFEYDKNRVLIEVGREDSIIAKRETLSVASPYQDGLSLFYYARSQLYRGKSVDIPTVVKEQRVTTHIDFSGEREVTEIDAIDYPIKTVHFEGVANFTGIFGLTGGFEGWFSDDDARVPIMAKMKVIIGSVTIELMGWKRPGWKPPRGKD